MVNLLDKALDELVNTIISLPEYKRCVEIKLQMQNNKELISLINNIKSLQKKYVNTNDNNILEEIKALENKLDAIPIYVTYNKYLEMVNEKISFVRDELNQYFDEVFKMEI